MTSRGRTSSILTVPVVDTAAGAVESAVNVFKFTFVLTIYSPSNNPVSNRLNAEPMFAVTGFNVTIVS